MHFPRKYIYLKIDFGLYRGKTHAVFRGEASGPGTCRGGRKSLSHYLYHLVFNYIHLKSRTRACILRIHFGFCSSVSRLTERLYPVDICAVLLVRHPLGDRKMRLFDDDWQEIGQKLKRPMRRRHPKNTTRTQAISSHLASVSAGSLFPTAFPTAAASLGSGLFVYLFSSRRVKW